MKNKLKLLTCCTIMLMASISYADHKSYIIFEDSPEFPLDGIIVKSRLATDQLDLTITKDDLPQMIELSNYSSNDFSCLTSSYIDVATTTGVQIFNFKTNEWMAGILGQDFHHVFFLFGAMNKDLTCTETSCVNVYLSDDKADTFVVKFEPSDLEATKLHHVAGDNSYGNMCY